MVKSASLPDGCQAGRRYSREVTSWASDVGRTLFVSDLDGTLLRPDGTLGERTVGVVNDLIAAGGLFTYATARSFTSASQVTAGLNLDLAVITYAGALIVDPCLGRPREAAMLPVAVVRAVQRSTAAPGSVQPILFTMGDGRDRVCWLAERSTKFVQAFLSTRAGDPRLLPLSTWAQIQQDSVFYVSLIGEYGQLQELRGRLGAELSGCHVVLTEDVYTPGQWWLELTSLRGTKAVALNTIRAEVQAERVVCFGDSHNDLPMFEVADVALAVENAVPEVRDCATAIIGGNATEGVAEWLALNSLLRQPI
jgi:Cof subfamily protein (haloacid dehalogenase superfamily)